MRICHITTVHPMDDTRIFFKECKGLAEKGHSVELIAQSSNKRSKYNIGAVSIIPINDYKNRLARMTFGIAEAFLKARKRKSDIFHLHDPELILVGLLLRLTGRRVVYDMHENVPAQLLEKQWIAVRFRRSLARLVKGIERISLRYLSVVMAETSYLEQYDWLPHKTTVLNLPDVKTLASLSQLDKRENPTVGYIGGVTANRGVFNTVSAVEKLRRDHEGLEFLCIGGVSHQVRENADFKRGINEGWIISPGRLSPEKGWPMVATCQIGLAILRRTGNYEHSYPTKMFEYMAMGLPVITSNFPLYREIVEKHECGLCVEPDSIDQITDAINFLLTNPDEAQRMGKNGKEAVERYFSWNVELEKLQSFYSEIMDRQAVKRS